MGRNKNARDCSKESNFLQIQRKNLFVMLKTCNLSGEKITSRKKKQTNGIKISLKKTSFTSEKKF